MRDDDANIGPLRPLVKEARDVGEGDAAGDADMNCLWLLEDLFANATKGAFEDHGDRFGLPEEGPAGGCDLKRSSGAFEEGEPEFGFEMLIDVCGVDYSQFGQTEWDTDSVADEPKLAFGCARLVTVSATGRSV